MQAAVARDSPAVFFCGEMNNNQETHMGIAQVRLQNGYK
jgi:hypothetical protein